MDKINLLKSTPLFASLEENTASLIASQMEKIEISDGGLVFEEGAVADSFYIVQEGEVVISKKLRGGRNKVLSVVRSGGVFGEMAFFYDSPRTASARVAGGKAVLWRMARDRFFDIVEKRPEDGIKIFSCALEVAMERLEKTSRELAAIYETGRIISAAGTIAEISQGVSDELLISFPQASRAAVFFYNEFNEEFENPQYPSVSSDNIFIKGLTGIAGKNTALVYPSEQFSADMISGATSPDFFKNSSGFIAVPIVNIGAGRRFPLAGFIILWNEKSGSDKDAKNLILNRIDESDVLLLLSVAGQLSEAFELLLRRQEELNRSRLKSDVSVGNGGRSGL